MVLAKLDSKIREKKEGEVIIGTLDCCNLRLDNAEVCVILENGDLFVGMKREVQVVT